MYGPVLGGELFGTVTGKRQAILGLAFNADTNDTREAPVILICRELPEKCARLAILYIKGDCPTERPGLLMSLASRIIALEWGF